MRTLTALLLMIFVNVAALCGEAGTTIVVKQLTEAQRDQLPEKTLQLKLQCYTLGSSPLAAALGKLIDEVRYEDLGHVAFVLKTAADSAGHPAIDITALQELSGDVMTKRAWGVVVRGGHCFVLLDKAPDSPFVKAKGKHTLVQEYEFVDEVIDYGPTRVSATWCDGELRKLLYVINGEDQIMDDGQLIMDNQ
ncbi:MAG: hypothetical protein IKR25_04950 [Muribaculaceae bacterium]|nr:hypothetical protein [Muribaculaceae bacterium]